MTRRMTPTVVAKRNVKGTWHYVMLVILRFPRHIHYKQTVQVTSMYHRHGNDVGKHVLQGVIGIVCSEEFPGVIISCGYWFEAVECVGDTRATDGEYIPKNRFREAVLRLDYTRRSRCRGTFNLMSRVAMEVELLETRLYEGSIIMEVNF